MIFSLKQFAAGSCYSYVLCSKDEAAIIDPHISLLAEYRNYLQKNKMILKYIIDTHTHADHFSLAAVMKKEFGAPIVMHEKAVSFVADKRVKDNEEILLGQGSLKIFYTPGHTDDAISILADDKLFTGDVLLIGSVGRTDFQNGSPESMFDTLARLKTLPDQVVVFPGHDYHGKRSSTIGAEKKENPFLQEADKDRFVANMRSKVLAKPFNIDNIVRVNQKGEAASLKMVSPKEASVLVEKNPHLKFLDVRSSFEFSQVHIKDALNVPIDMLLAKTAELSQSKQGYIVLCRTGNRSPMAADMLVQSGVAEVMVLDGGMTRWEKEHLAVIKGVGGVSLERQVRAVAGSLIIIGVLLALFVHAAFIFLPLFVGCGLLFAGVTDSCLMGMLLMKLPYNKNLYKAKLGGGTCAISG